MIQIIDGWVKKLDKTIYAIFQSMPARIKSCNVIGLDSVVDEVEVDTSL